MIKQESTSIIEHFNRVYDITKRNLRSSNLNLRSSRLKIKHGQSYFAYRGTAIWNSLPKEIKLEDTFRTFDTFQSKLKAMLAGKDSKIDLSSYFTFFSSVCSH